MGEEPNRLFGLAVGVDDRFLDQAIEVSRRDHRPERRIEPDSTLRDLAMCRSFKTPVGSSTDS